MRLDDTLVITADLGELRVFRVKKHEAIMGNDMKVSHSLELVTDLDYIEGRKKLGESVSDKAGNFVGANGEEHNLELEREKRTLKDIAQDIDSVVSHEKPKQLLLAFPKESLLALEELLSQNTKAVLTKSVAADLTKTDKNKILSHFE